MPFRTLFRAKRRADPAADEAAAAMALWRAAENALSAARRRFDEAADGFRIDAAIFEMGAAEADRNRALAALRRLEAGRADAG